MVPLSVMDPEDFCERFRLNDDVVPDAKLNGNGLNELVDGWMVFGLKERNQVSLGKPVSGELEPRGGGAEKVHPFDLYR